MRVVLLLLFLISALPLRKRGIVLACSSNDFNSIYDVYPSCAVACLACPDAEYEGDFYNSCDYPSGICCLTQYRTVINATFTCVAQNCPGQAQKAFNVFVDFCADKDVPLDPSVVPAGYVLNTDAGELLPLEAIYILSNATCMALFKSKQIHSFFIFRTQCVNGASLTLRRSILVVYFFFFFRNLVF